MRVLRPLAAPWLLALSGAGVAVGLEVWAGVLEDRGLRLPPVVETVAWVLGFWAVSMIVWGVVRVVRRVGPRLRPGKRRMASVGGLLVAHVAAIGGLLVLMLVADPRFPFGPTYRDSIRSPRGSTIYLYAGGFFCGYQLYERPAGAFYAKRLFSIHPDGCVDDVRVQWSEQFDEPIVVGPDGQRVVDGTALQRAFDWRPH